MAWESGGTFITLPLTTGLRQYRFVKVNTSGNAVYPSASTVGEAVVGVLVSEGTTGSTVDPVRGGTIQIGGVAKVEAEASTVAKGDTITASSVGRVQSSSNAGDYAVGIVVDGSSGAANRVVSVLLSPIGTT